MHVAKARRKTIAARSRKSGDLNRRAITAIETLTLFIDTPERVARWYGTLTGKQKRLLRRLEAREAWVEREPDPDEDREGEVMIAEPTLQFTPFSSYLRVRRTQAATMTASGLFLPETAQRRPGEGTVVACGPGRPIPGTDSRSIIWEMEGDLILFQPSDFHEVTGPFDGLVSAEKVVAQVMPNGEILPENAWLKVNPDTAAEQSRGGVLLPDGAREQSQRGVILDLGPGELRLSGPLAGTRKTIREIMGLGEDEPLIGRVVWWEGAHKSLSVSGDDPCLLVRAIDLTMIAEEDSMPE